MAMVADQTDSWRGMAFSSRWRSATCKKRSRLVRSLRSPPALQLRIDRRRAVDLRQRAFFLRLALLLPLGDERIGLGEGVLERAAGGKRVLEKSAAEVGEVVLVGAAKRGAIMPRGGDDQGPVVPERLD